jgi:hypothetical protein
LACVHGLSIDSVNISSTSISLALTPVSEIDLVELIPAVVHGTMPACFLPNLRDCLTLARFITVHYGSLHAI